MENSNLKKYVSDFLNMVELYDDNKGHHYKELLEASIFNFLDNENDKNAYEVFETFFMIYQITSEDKSEFTVDQGAISNEDNTLLDLVKIMKKYEKYTGELIKKQRDHFIHSVNVFLLGLAIYSQNWTYRAFFQNYIKRSKYVNYYKINETDFSHEEFLYRWGIASLFHDIGYPVEIVGKQMEKFINDSVKSISFSYDVNTAIEFKDFNEFNTIRRIDHDFADDFVKCYPEAKFLDLFKPTDLMAFKIKKDFVDIDLNNLKKHLNKFIEIMGESGFIDHGFFSSILVLNSYGYLIQKFSKNYNFFFYPIVDSATAILLHNYYRNVLMKKDGDFKLGKLSPIKSPLSFLLILCDELQEWNRQPLGTEDKAKSHINQLEINITNYDLNLNYIVNSGALGLGFSQKKEDFLNNVLDLDVLFLSGLDIKTDVKYANIIKDMEKIDLHTPSILLRNVEILARKIHEDYVEGQEKEGKAVEKDFSKLSPEDKMSNVRQAKSIAKKLQLVGCEMAPIGDSRKEYAFTPDEIVDLAILEHEDWCEHKKANGWFYGETRDDSKKIHPDIAEWVDMRYVSVEDAEKIVPRLKDNRKMLDIDAVKNIPQLLNSIGMKVVMSKLRALTIKKHEFYSESNDVEQFDDLPFYIKFLNFKQNEVLIKSLGELKLDLVSMEHPSNGLEELSEEQVEYLAKRDHAEWYNSKLNLGWQYGEEKTAETNPNLVEWDDLKPEVKASNKRTFEVLPRLCNEVGLKIVEN